MHIERLEQLLLKAFPTDCRQDFVRRASVIPNVIDPYLDLKRSESSLIYWNNQFS